MAEEPKTLADLPGYARKALTALGVGPLVIDKFASVKAYRQGMKTLEGGYVPTGHEFHMSSTIDWLVERGYATNTLGRIDLTSKGAELLPRMPRPVVPER